jgi:cytoskeletal protein RodZ
MSEGNRRVNRQPPWDGSKSAEPGAFGAWLRREREAREIALAEIAEVTKISKAYLHALEDERFDVLPAPVFAKGFLREYAKYVGLDPDEVVNSYLTALQASEPQGPVDEVAHPRRSSFEWTSGVLLAVGLVLLLALIGFVGFWAERSQGGTAATPGPRDVASAMEVALPEAPGLDFVPPPVVEAPKDDAANTEAEATSPLIITLDFTEDCWVEAAVDGHRRLSELHVQGESLRIDAQERVELTLGNPGGVVVEVNGAPYSLADYRPGRVARDIVIAIEDGA